MKNSPLLIKELGMDIQIIEEAIQSLEYEDVTYDNVAELASLYIVYNNLKRPLNSMTGPVESELQDILPSYKVYCESKRRYQLGKTNEGEVIKNLKLLGTEITEFIEALYSGTDMKKERVYIVGILTQITEKLSK